MVERENENLKLSEILGWTERFSLDFNQYLDLKGDDDAKTFLAKACVALIERVIDYEHNKPSDVSVTITKDSPKKSQAEQRDVTSSG